MCFPPIIYILPQLQVKSVHNKNKIKVSRYLRNIFKAHKSDYNSVIVYIC